MFCEEKKSKCPKKKKKFSKCEEGGKCLSVGFRVFGKFWSKKNVRVVCYPVSWAPCWLKSSITWANWEVKIAVAEKKKEIRDFYLLGLCPLVGRKKNDWLFWGKGEKKKNGENFPKYFSGRGLCLTHVWAPCCETWLKIWKIK